MRVGRAIVRFVACLLAGAATTVALSTAIALRGIDASALTARDDDEVAYLLPDGQALISSHRGAGPGWTIRAHGKAPVLKATSETVEVWHQTVLSSKPPPYRRVSAPLIRAPAWPAGANGAMQYRFGWPLRATWAAEYANAGHGFVDFLPPGRLIVLRENSFGGFYFLRNIPRRAVAIPVGIVPLGFAANTAIYAAVWFTVFVGPGAARRFLRRRRGLCATCAYDLRGTPAGSPCPECGQTHARRAAAALPATS